MGYTDYAGVAGVDGSLNQIMSSGYRGWIDKPKIAKTKELNFKVVIDPMLNINKTDSNELLERYYYEIAQTCAKQILDSGFLKMELQSNRNPYKTGTEISASLTLADRGIYSVEIKEKMFSTHGLYFNENDISKALMKTYPERFL